MTTTETRMEEAYQVLKKLAENETPSDECTLYGELLATKLRALDENIRAVAMLEIDTIMLRFKQQKNYPSSSRIPTNPWFGQYFQPTGCPSTISYPHASQQSSSSSASTLLNHQPSPSYSYESNPSPQYSQSSAPPTGMQCNREESQGGSCEASQDIYSDSYINL